MQFKNPKIFVIEDNIGDVLLIQESLTARGIEAQVEVVRDGEKAMADLDAMGPAEAPRLMIIDLNLPRVNGLDLLRKTRNSPKFDRTAVMVLTSSRSPGDKAEAEKLGADVFVSKPLTLDDFLKSVGDAVQRLLAGEMPKGLQNRSVTVAALQEPRAPASGFSRCQMTTRAPSSTRPSPRIPPMRTSMIRLGSRGAASRTLR